MAAVDTTISTTTWISNVAAGAANGSSLADRKTLTGIGSLTVNADVALNLVHDSTGANWAIALGNGEVANKTFTCYGSLNCMTETGVFSKQSAIRCAIGGTTGYKSGATTLWGPNNIFNIDWGQDASGNSATTGAIYTQGNLYWYNCTAKITGNYVLYTNGANTVLESCALTASYGIYKQYGDMTLIACTITASQASGFWMNVIQSSSVRIVGGITLAGGGAGSINFVAQALLCVQFYRRAFVKTTTDGSTALSGTYYSATEATGGVDMPLASGITGADGLCTPESPTAYNDAIWCLQKVETYIRTTAGAMTWGTPTSTTTYGSYTLAFGKAGYVFQTATHDFTDGADWGTSSVPIAITMVATPLASPVISNATIDDSSIGTTGSSLVECDIAGMDGSADESVVIRLGTTNQYVTMTSTNNAHYTGRIYGWQAPTGAHNLKIQANFTDGGDNDTSLTLTITEEDSDPVTTIVGLLDANWNASNVTKPTIIDAGDRGLYNLRDGDILKVYYSERPDVRLPRGESMTRYDVSTFVTIDIKTANATDARVRCKALVDEAERVLNGFRNVQTGGWDRIWVNQITKPSEYPDYFNAIMDVELRKLFNTTRT